MPVRPIPHLPVLMLSGRRKKLPRTASSQLWLCLASLGAWACPERTPRLCHLTTGAFLDLAFLGENESVLGSLERVGEYKLPPGV